MKKIVLLILLFSLTSLLAKDNLNEYSISNFKIGTTNEVQTTYKSIKFSDSSKSAIPGYVIPDDTLSNYRFKYENATHIHYDNILLAFTGGVLKNNSNIVREETYNTFQTQDKSKFYINQLYVKVHEDINDELRLGLAYGIIPFTGGNFKQYSTQDKIEGNGLMTITDIVIRGGWGILEYNNLKIKAGYGEWFEDNFYNDQKLGKMMDSSGGFFSSVEYTIDTGSSKQLIQFDYDNIDTIYNTPLNGRMKMADEQLFGLGYSFEDYENSYVIYTILGYSISKEYGEDVIPYMGLPPFVTAKNETYTGTSMLIGIKKYIDINSQEFSIGYEYFETSPNFVSFNVGSIFDNDYSVFNRRGTKMHKIYSDFIVNNKYIFSLSAYTANNRYTSNGISIGDTTSTPMSLTPFYKKEVGVQLQFGIRF